MKIEKRAWMIYGANGYTGRLIVAEAVKRGLQPVLAGRNAEEISRLGDRYGLPTRIFPCEKGDALAEGIAGMAAVIHCAGPFSATSSPMLKACMANKTHYLDITGEIAVFERILSRAAEIAAAGIVAVPGVGFDVMPSDCLAAMLHSELPDATHLELILKPRGALSPGTMKTMVEGFYVGTVLRRDGRIELLEQFEVARRNFRGKEKFVLGIAWGDIATAFYSTGIPNIRIFLVTTPKSARLLQQLQKLRRLWKLPLVQVALKKFVGFRVKGPSEKDLADAGYQIWGTVRNAGGENRSLGISTPNGYRFTADSALASLEAILANTIKPGAYTPSGAFGKDFVRRLPGVEVFRA